MTELERKQLEWPLVAKGIGITLVVMGHFFPPQSPVYWIEFKEIIYSFHMPLFFLISGYLYGFSGNKYSYKSLILNKVERLILPFVSIAMIFFVIKLLAGSIFHLDKPADLSSIYALLVRPEISYMPLLWYVHALFIIFVFYPLFRAVFGNFTMFILLLILNAVVSGGGVVIDRAISYMPYFIFGIMLAEKAVGANVLLGSTYGKMILPLFLFVIIYAIFRSFNSSVHDIYLVRCALGVLGGLFVVNVSYFIVERHYKGKGLMSTLGYYSMSIYLFHTLFESFFRILFYQVFPRTIFTFELAAIFAISAGIIMPLLMEKYMLRKYSCTRRFILGIK